MPFWLTLLAVFPAFLLLFVIFVVFQTVLRLSQPGNGIHPVSREDFPEKYETACELEGWAVNQGFEFCGGFRLDTGTPIFVAAWQKPGQSEYLLEYQAPHLTHYDRVTIFAEDHALTTASTKDAQFLPQPIGSFVQSFPGLELDELMERHEGGRKYLRGEYGLMPVFIDAKIDELVNQAILRQMQYVRSIPFWAFRGPWWYFVNRETLKGQPVEVLYPPSLRSELPKSA